MIVLILQCDYNYLWWASITDLIVPFVNLIGSLRAFLLLPIANLDSLSSCINTLSSCEMLVAISTLSYGAEIREERCKMHVFGSTLEGRAIVLREM